MRSFEGLAPPAAALLLLPGLAGCTADGAPSLTLFGAFFPAWMACGLAGIVVALAGRAVFVASGLSSVLPFQLLLCTAIGVIAALLLWLLWFGQ